MVALKYKDPVDGLYKLVPVGLSTSAADTRYVNVNGDTMTNSLKFSETADCMVADSAAPANQNFLWKVGNKIRWTIGKNSAAESGSNNGTDLSISAWDDAGNYLYQVLRGTRIDGLLTVRANPTQALGIATKQYVDAVAAGYTTTIGDGSALSYTVTHNLNTQNCHVTVRQTATPFERIDCVVRFTTVNTVTIVCLTAPAAGAYTVTVSK